MKVTVITSQFPYLSETFIVDQIVGILKLGHQVRIISVSHPDMKLAQPEVQRYDLLKITRYLQPDQKGRVAELLFCVVAFIKLLLKYPGRAPKLCSSCLPFSTPKRIFVRLLGGLHSDNPDVVHCHFGPNGELVTRAREVLGGSFAVVTSFWGCDMGTSSDPNRYSDLFRLGDSFVANTSFTKKRITELGGAPNRTSIMPIGVDLSKIPFTNRLVPLATDRLRLLTVARLVEFKGLDIAIRAVASLKQQGIDVQYRIVGTGHLKSNLQNLAKELQVEKEVTFLGGLTRENIVHELASAHVFVLPSIEFAGRTETQGLVVQEAQASGVPVVASEIGGLPDAITHGETGLLFPAGNVDALTECILTVGRDSDLRSRISRKGRAMVESQYDNNTLACSLEQIYREVMTPNLASDVHSKVVA